MKDPWDELLKHRPVTPQTYRRRRLVLVLFLAVAVLIGVAIAEGTVKDEVPIEAVP